MMLTKDQFMMWFSGFIFLAFFAAGIFGVLDYFIVKLILFSCVSFVVAIIFYILFSDENKKSPEDDSE